MSTRKFAKDWGQAAMESNVYMSKSTAIPFSIRISGLGGQGNVLMGTILADALVKDGKWVIQTQAYGAQVRGGLTLCDVLFSDEPIDFPKARNFDMIFAMHDLALKQHSKFLKNNGILFVDSSMCGEIPRFIQSVTRKIISFPITKISEELFGRKVYANVINLGVVAASTKIVSYDNLKKAILEHVPSKYADTNLKALDEGYHLSDKVYTLREKLKIPYSHGSGAAFE